MTTFNEQLDRGLYTAADKALLPPGALVKAQNARYAPGDPAIRQAEGSVQVVGSHVGLNSLAGVAWDAGAARVADILYNSGSLFRVVPAKADPLDPAMNTPTTLAIPAGAAPYLRNVIAVGQRFYIQTSGKGMVLSESSGVLSLRRHGLPRQTLQGRPVATINGTEAMDHGVYRFWWTWYDQANDIESAATLASTTGYWLDALAANFAIYVLKSAFDTAWLAAGSPSHIRVYRAPLVEVDEAPYLTSSGATITNNFPAGFLVAEREVASPGVKAGTTTLTAAGAGYINLWNAYPAGEYYTLTGGYSVSPALDKNVAFEAPYDVVDVGVLYSRDGEPPQATTGDIHEDSLVVNDTLNPRIVRYTPPGDYDSFPDPYYVPLDTQEKDAVRCIRSLGAVTGIFCDNTIWRLNYLPLEGDLNFRQGKGKDLIAVGIGTINERGVCRVDIEGKGAMLATCARTGVYLTDLDVTRKISGHLDWATVLPDPSSFVALLNNFEEQRIELWTRSGAWFFHYDAAHIGEDGNLAVTGPIERGAVALAITAPLEDGSKRTVTAGDVGEILIYEGLGDVRSDGADPLLEVETREVFPAGPGSEVRTIVAYALAAQSGAGSTNLTVSVSGRVQDKTTLVESKAFPIGERSFVIAPIRAVAEALQFRLAGLTPLGVKVSFVGATIEPMEDAQHA